MVVLAARVGSGLVGLVGGVVFLLGVMVATAYPAASADDPAGHGAVHGLFSPLADVDTSTIIDLRPPPGFRSREAGVCLTLLDLHGRLVS